MSETAEDLMDLDTEAVDLHKVNRLTRELKDAAVSMGRDEARYLVDAYYAMQDFRTQGANQRRAAQHGDAPAMMLHDWLTSQFATLETRCKDLLGAFASGQQVGRWSMLQYGVGPVIAAGLLAHIDIAKAPTVGHIYRYAGLDPSAKWIGRDEATKLLAEVGVKGSSVADAEQVAILAGHAGLRYEALVSRIVDKDGQPQKWTAENVARALSKRPWNAELKCLCWKASQCFVKFSNQDACFYGHRYQERKALEVQRNEAGEYAEEAARALREKSYKRDTGAKACYEAGKLPPGHLQARATRWAVKLVLAHWWEVAYICHHGAEPPPAPYAIAHLGHTDKIGIPLWPCA